MTVFFEIIVFILTIIVCTLAYFNWKFSYWRNKHVPFVEPKFPYGTVENPFNRKHNSAIVFQNQYNYFKSLGYEYGGLYLFVRPGFLLVDLEMVKNVMLKHFQYFTDRGVYHNEKDDPLSANLFNLEGQQWRNLRAKLTPTFTTGKIKTMFSTLLACGEPLRMAIAERKEPIDVKDILARFTTDVIGSCAFGIECNSFKEPAGDFRKYGEMVFSPFSNLQALKFLVANSNPALAKRLGITIMNPEPKEFFLNVVKETIAYRKRNNIVRNDFMQLLMNLTDEDLNGEELTIEQVAAQAFVFYVAGFETSSTTMTFCLCELAVNQEIQNKVRDEINTVLTKYDGNITYEAVMEMKYLNSVVDETLRKYPPLAYLPRVCVQNYQVPDAETILEKGTRVIIPVYALHHDPEYFPNPEKFDPERFNDDNKASIRPFTYLPFGEGPRICIGQRFGLLQTKVGLVILLKSFRLSLNARTKFPLQFQRASFILTADGGVWLDTETISTVNE